MFNLCVSNKENMIDFNNNTAFTITGFEGLEPSEVYISENDNAILDGTTLNHMKVNPRTIFLSFIIEYDAEYNRMQMYKIFQQKKVLNFEFEGNYRHVKFDAVVQNIKIGFFEMKQTVDITLYCAFPFFRDAQIVVNEVNQIVKQFYFPFYSTTEEPIKMGYIDTFAQIIIENKGDVECGMQLELYARDKVVNPKVYNYISQEFIGVDFEMNTGDVILFDTQKGRKTIQLLRNGILTNIFNKKMKDVTWLQLETGANAFVHQAQEGIEHLTTTIKHTPLYGGV